MLLALIIGCWSLTIIGAQEVIQEQTEYENSMSEAQDHYSVPQPHQGTITLNVGSFNAMRQTMNTDSDYDDSHALSGESVTSAERAEKHTKVNPGEELADQIITCEDPTIYRFVPGTPRSFIFNDLSEDEILSVANYLLDNTNTQDKKLLFWEGEYTNKGAYVPEKEVPTTDTNQILRIYVMPPEKKEALKFLDGVTNKPPARYARVVIQRGQFKDIMEYKVGPLPFLEGVPVEFSNLTYDGEIPFSKRPLSPSGTTWQLPVVGQAAYQLKDIFLNITGYCYPLPYYPGIEMDLYRQSQEECPNKTKIDYLPYPVITKNASARISRVHWYYYPAGAQGDEGNLHSLPLSFAIDESDYNNTKWTAYDFEYCNQGPYQLQQFLDLWNNNSLTVCSPDEWKTPEYNYQWASTYKQDVFSPEGGRQPIAPSEFIAGPRQYEPEGKRYILVGNDTYVGRRFAWMGWEGHITLRPDTGLALYDIKFKGERIVYELALQDQYVAYSGYSGAGQVLYFDSNFGMGMTTNGLRHGIDCPESAIYFDATKMYLNGQILVDRDVICMFEIDMSETEWRHMHAASAPGPKLEGIRRTELVVRSISTISNYDYIYDVRFKLDASIRVRVQMAGYMETLYFDPYKAMTKRDKPFGTRVGKYAFANLHDHLSGWKVDLDVKGPLNQFQTSTVQYGTYKDAFLANNIVPPPKDMSALFNPDALGSADEDFNRAQWFPQQKLKYLNTTKILTEMGLRVNISEPAVWQFINEQAHDNYYPAGYAIIPGPTHLQLLPDDHPFVKAASWTKYHLAVTQHKDDEYVSHAAMYDLYVPDKPFRTLDSFLNGESIVNQDLVGWVMIGLEHIPRSEDVPLISNLGVHFELKPWNYFNELQSMDVVEKQKFAHKCIPNSGNYFNYYWHLDQDQ